MAHVNPGHVQHGELRAKLYTAWERHLQDSIKVELISELRASWTSVEDIRMLPCRGGRGKEEKKTQC